MASQAEKEQCRPLS